MTAPATSSNPVLDGVEFEEDDSGAPAAPAEPETPFTDFVSIPEILGVLRRES